MIFFFNLIRYYLPIIPYQLTKFQAPSSNTFRDSLLTRFHSDLLCWHDFTLDFFKVTLFQKGRQLGQEKKYWVSYFSIRNPYMKFQNPSMHGSEDMACIKKRDAYMWTLPDGHEGDLVFISGRLKSASGRLFDGIFNASFQTFFSKIRKEF